jgi:hypothetical protein
MQRTKLCLCTPNLSSEERVRKAVCENFRLEDCKDTISFVFKVASVSCWGVAWFEE